ncbi:unnamed protein product [Linum trigynum]|uniref:Uncharacterized protein n=1 Tax=Linum trigynum TaxID=586398 RepID=A0AAV2GPL1_9ROSI
MKTKGGGANLFPCEPPIDEEAKLEAAASRVASPELEKQESSAMVDGATRTKKAEEGCGGIGSPPTNPGAIALTRAEQQGRERAGLLSDQGDRLSGPGRGKEWAELGPEHRLKFGREWTDPEPVCGPFFGSNEALVQKPMLGPYMSRLTCILLNGVGPKLSSHMGQWNGPEELVATSIYWAKDGLSLSFRQLRRPSPPVMEDSAMEGKKKRCGGGGKVLFPPRMKKVTQEVGGGELLWLANSLLPLAQTTQ